MSNQDLQILPSLHTKVCSIFCQGYSIRVRPRSMWHDVPCAKQNSYKLLSGSKLKQLEASFICQLSLSIGRLGRYLFRTPILSDMLLPLLKDYPDVVVEP